MTQRIEEEAGSSRGTISDVDLIGTLDIYKSRVRPKDDKTVRLQVIPVGPK